MPLPLRLLAVDRQVYVYIFVSRPLVHDLVIVHQILHAPGAVYDVQHPVAVAVVAAVVDHGAQRRQTDTARDEQQILARERRVHGEAVAVRTADRDLLTDLHRVEPVRHTATLLDRKLHVLLVRRRGRNGKHRLSDARDRQHRALSRLMLERLFSVRRDHAEGLDVRRVDTDVRHHTNDRHQRFSSLSHRFSLPQSSSPLRYSSKSDTSSRICRSRRSYIARRCSPDSTPACA